MNYHWKVREWLRVIGFFTIISIALIYCGIRLTNTEIHINQVPKPQIITGTNDRGTIEVSEEILYEFTTGGVLKDNFKPQLFLKITGTDLSRCFIDGRLRVDLNGEIYWIRLER